LVEYEPFVALEINGQALPFSVSRLIERLEISEEAGKKTMCQFTFRDVDGSFSDSNLFVPGQIFVVSAGYVQDHQRRGPFEIVETDEELEDTAVLIKVKAEEGGRLSSRLARRVFSAGTVRDIFETVLASSGLDLVVEGVDALDEILSDQNPVIQSGESDGLFLRRLATNLGLDFSIINGKGHITPPSARPSLGIVKLSYADAYSGIRRLSLKTKKGRMVNVPNTQARGRETPIESKLNLVRGNPNIQEVLEELEAQQGAGDVDVQDLITRAQGIPQNRTGIEVTEILNEARNRQVRFEDRKLRAVAGPDAELDPPVNYRDIPDKKSLIQNPGNVAEILGADTIEEDLGLSATDLQDELLGGGSIESLITSGNSLGADLDTGPTLAQAVAQGTRQQDDPAFTVTINDQGQAVRTPVPTTAQQRQDPFAQTPGSVYDPQSPENVPLAPEGSKKDQKKIRQRREARLASVVGLAIELRLGTMLFRPHTNLEISGATKKINGQYRITKVRHTFSGGSSFAFETVLESKRGLYKPPKKDSDKQANQPVNPDDAARSNQAEQKRNADDGGPERGGRREVVRIGEFGEVERVLE